MEIKAYKDTSSGQLFESKREFENFLKKRKEIQEKAMKEKAEAKIEITSLTKKLACYTKKENELSKKYNEQVKNKKAWNLEKEAYVSVKVAPVQKIISEAETNVKRFQLVVKITRGTLKHHVSSAAKEFKKIKKEPMAGRIQDQRNVVWRKRRASERIIEHLKRKLYV